MKKRLIDQAIVRATDELMITVDRGEVIEARPLDYDGDCNGIRCNKKSKGFKPNPTTGPEIRRGKGKIKKW